MTAVSVENITKRYGKTVALDGVSFEVEKGELFGIIGPDGAGKTTLFRIIATLILADSGTASVDGFDVVRDYKELRKRIGYMPGRFSLYQDLTSRRISRSSPRYSGRPSGRITTSWRASTNFSNRSASDGRENSPEA